MIIATAGTLDDHLRDVGMVFDKLIQAGFAVKCSKVHLAKQDEIPYLGFMISSAGVKPGAAKTQALLDMVCEEMGTDPKAAARFAGMIGFFRSHVQNLHSTLAPFHELKQKQADSSRIMMSLRFKAAFAVLKYQLANVTALTRPDYTKPFYLDVDSASSVGSGAILSQLADPNDPDSLRPIAFWSRRFTDEERRYGVRDQECMGLVDALEAWRPYVFGAPVRARTDHKSLEWMLTTKHRDGTRASGFALKLQGYDVNIEYSPGKDGVGGADCMSRAIPAGEGGEERGVIDTRPSVEDRLHEMVHRRTTITATAHTGVPSPRYDIEPKPTTTVTADRVVALVLRQSKSGVEVLVERQDSACSLPTATVDRHSRATQRDQLCHQLQLNYGESSPLPAAVRGARVYRNQRSQNGISRYFAACVDSAPLSSADARFDTAFIALDVDTVNDTLSLSADREILLHFIRNFLSTSRALRQSAAVGTAVAEPAITPSPFAALVVSQEEIALASARMGARLRAHPGLSIAVDLEGHQLGAGGHISLVQCAVDGIQGDKLEADPLVYVFDITCSGQHALGAAGPDTLRHILEDEHIPKVFHCCYGDATALYQCYGISLRCVFDTAIADCVALAQNANKSRSLSKTLITWLGADVVNLHFKGIVEHTPDLWDQRPLSTRNFIYAYEDVTYCNRLYSRLCAVLREQGVLELVFALSQQRVPPVSLPRYHVQYKPPLRVALALVDRFNRVICLQDRVSGLCSLPSAAFEGRLTDLSQAKQFAKEMWTAVMGAPPKSYGLRAAVNARLRKAVRIGDTLLYAACIDDCVTALDAVLGSRPPLTAAHPDDGQRVVIRCRHNSGRPSDGVSSAQQLLFQELHADALRAEQRVCSGGSPDATHGIVVQSNCAFRGRSRRARWRRARRTTGIYDDGVPDTELVHVFQIGTGPGQLAVNADLGVTNGHVSLRLFRTITATPSFAIAAAASQAKGPTRTAVILHDATHAFVVTNAKGAYEIPSLGKDPQASTADMAARVIECFGGNSLRKRAGVNSNATAVEMPVVSSLVRAAEDGALELGCFGNAEYVSWWFDASSVPLFSSLPDHEAAFHAARMPAAGYSQVQTKKDQYPQFAIIDVYQHRQQFQQHEQEAITLALDRIARAQHSGDTTEGITTTATALAASTPVPPAQHSGDSGQPFDEEEEALCIAAVAMRVAFLEHACRTAAHAKAGSTDTAPMLTRAQILEEQMSHPGTAQYIEYLQLGELRSEPGQLPEERLEFIEEARTLCLASDGLLLKRAADGYATDRIVLPPAAQKRVLRLYHDFNFHFGVSKIYPLVVRRFYWGTAEEMRKTIGEHLRHCKPCSRVKLPPNRAGSFQIGDVGAHPFSILSADVYDVGIVFDEFSHTLDYVCHFSKRVVTNAMRGMPNSEGVVDTLVNVVIRHHGKPDEIRSDRGSNLISKAIKILYERFKIKITAGTAHHHHLVGLLERWHRTLKQLILVQRAAGADDNWPSRLPLMELAFNTTVNASTGYSPFFLDHLRQGVLPLDAMLAPAPNADDKTLPDWVKRQLETCRVVYDAQLGALRLHAVQAKKRYDLKRDVVAAFSPGDLVLLIRGEVMDHAPFPKAAIPTDGPFTVARRLAHDRYVLTDMHNKRVHNVVHVARLVLYPAPPDDDPEWMVSDPHTGGTWPVHSVVDRRRPQGSSADATDITDFEYRVRFAGFNKKYDKWLHRRYLANITPLITHYEESAGIAPPPLLRAIAYDTSQPAVDPAVQQAPRFTRHAPAAHQPPPLLALPAPSAPATDMPHLALPPGAPAADAPRPLTAPLPTLYPRLPAPTCRWPSRPTLPPPTTPPLVPSFQTRVTVFQLAPPSRFTIRL